MKLTDIYSVFRNIIKKEEREQMITGITVIGVVFTMIGSTLLLLALILVWISNLIN